MIKVAQAWSNLVVCTGGKADPCTFNKLTELARNLMNDLIELSVIAAVIGFIYIGVTMLTSSGKPDALSKAKKTAWSLLVGFFFVLAAWVIVYTITHALLSNPDSYTLLK